MGWEPSNDLVLLQSRAGDTDLGWQVGLEAISSTFALQLPTSNDFSETSNSKSRLISNVFISLFLSWVFPWSNWSLQGRRLHPKTCCSKYPQHQMLLRKHTGECVGQDNPYFPSLSHITHQRPALSCAAFSSRDPGLTWGYRLGKTVT